MLGAVLNEITIYISRVSPGFDLVSRITGQPTGSTGFDRFLTFTGFLSYPDRFIRQFNRFPGQFAEPIRV